MNKRQWDSLIHRLALLLLVIVACTLSGCYSDHSAAASVSSLAPCTVGPGQIQATGAPLDVAIKGDGFFRVRLADGRDGFTRAGSLQLDGAGELIVPVSDGWYRLVPNIVVPAGATQVSILPNGDIQYTPRCGDVRATAGRLPLNRFAVAPALHAKGNNLYTQTARSGPPIVCQPGTGGAGILQQGFLENLD